jgi:hypothetical protein
LVIDITVDSNSISNSFLTGLISQQIQLLPGQSHTVNVTVDDFIPSVQFFTQDILFGVGVDIKGYKFGEPQNLLLDEDIFAYRFFDVADDGHGDGIVEMADTANDGVNGVVRQRSFLRSIGASAAPTFDVLNTAHFPETNFPNAFTFDPTATANDLTTALRVMTPEGNIAGALTLLGDGTQQEWFVDIAVLNTVLTGLSTGAIAGATAAERLLIDTAGERTAVINNVITRAETLLNAFDPGWTRVTAVTVNSVDVNVFDIANERIAGVPTATTLGSAFLVDNQQNGGMVNLIANRNSFNTSEQNFRLSEVLNELAVGQVDIYVDRYFSFQDFAALGIGALENALAKTLAHEIGHTGGLNHTAGGGSIINIPNAGTDVMAQGIDTAGTRTFNITANAASMAFGTAWTSAQAQQAMNYFAAYIAAGGNFDSTDAEGGPDPDIGNGLPVGVGVAQIFSLPDATVPTLLDFGTVAADGAGGASVTRNLVLTNLGDTNLTINSFALLGANGAFTIGSPIAAGTVLTPLQQAPFSITFDPTLATGEYQALVVVESNGAVSQLSLNLKGIAQSPNSDIFFMIDNNNLGGVKVGDPAKVVTGFSMIENIGAAPLTITSIAPVGGNGQFSVSGLPAGFGPGSPIVLNTGQSITINVGFDANAIGLQTAGIEVRSNDPDAPVAVIPVVATGLADTGSSLVWGSDFILLETGDHAPARIRSDVNGNFHFYLDPNTPYTLSIFDPDSGLVSHSTGLSDEAGTPTDFGPPFFEASTVLDENGNGLPDDIDRIIGPGKLFDFGTASSPVAAGYTKVTPTNTYSAGTGFGWLSVVSQPVGATDTNVPSVTSPLLTDFNSSSDATFVVDLPNGYYDVSVTLGDAVSDHKQMAVFAEGQLRANVSTGAGAGEEPFSTKTFRAVVTDGQLTLRFQSQAGQPVAVNAIEIQQFALGVNGAIPTEQPLGLFFFLIEDLETGFILRGSNDLQAGEFLCPNGVILDINAPHRQWVLQADTGLVGISDFTTPGPGQQMDMPAIVLGQDLSPDSDGDGLNDVAEFIIGTNPNNADTDNDGIRDLAEIQQRLDPLGGLGIPTGLIASLPLLGSAEEVVAVGSTLSAQKQTAYVATGSYGLAVVDFSAFTSPIVLGQLDLPGDAVDVAVDAARNIAVVVGSAGVHFVDVSDPMMPVLRQTVALPLGATTVEILDGVAYAGTGLGEIVSLEIVTGERLETLSLGFNPITGMAREGTLLYTMDSAKTLRVLDIANVVIATRGSLTLTDGGGKLFVGNGLVLATAVQSSDGAGGFSTVDVSNPNAPVLISGADANFTDGTMPKAAIAANGSGLAVIAGSNFAQNQLQIVSLADPLVTNNTLGVFQTPSAAKGLAIASGIAFVAGGTGGLQVYNYLGFDTLGVAPTVSITSPITDADPGTPGIQIVEGSSVPIRVQVSDDTQVRNIELLVGGVLADNDVSFPFDFVALAPALGPGVTSINLQVRATDTGGNQRLSNLLTFELVEDIVPPSVIDTAPDPGQKVFFTPSIDVLFNEPLDETRLNLTGVALFNLGADGVVGGGDDIQVAIDSIETRTQGRRLAIFPSTILDTGNHRLTLDPSIVADRGGNALAAPFTLDFTVRPASDIAPLSGTKAIDRAPGANPGQLVSFVIPGITTTTAVAFSVINDSNGTVTIRQVTPFVIDTTTQRGFYFVPTDAVTGNVTIPGDLDGPFIFQIVPVVTGVDLTSVNTAQANFTLSGLGFIEGNGTRYTIGSVTTIDGSPSLGPDVFSTNTRANVNNVVFEDGVFGAVVVTTAGGTSAPFSVGYTELASTAVSGTPANAGAASANPGQVVLVRGTGLSLSTDLVARYVADNTGAAVVENLTPFYVNATGTEAQVLLPSHYNGAFALNVVGSSFAPLLQIVPVVTAIDVTGTTNATVQGFGFTEANGTVYAWAGGSLTDTAQGTGPDVFSSATRANVDAPVHGFGTFTMTTPGGTSAPLALNHLNVGELLRDLAYDPTTGRLWIATNDNPAQIHRLNPATGVSEFSFDLTAAGFGTATFFGGLQILPSGIASLGGTAVPAGSLLIINGQATNDRIIAVNPTTGAVLASLTLPGTNPSQNYDATAGLYDPTSGHLFLASFNRNPDQVFELDPATGAQLNAFNTPFDINHGGMALDPVSNNFWIGSDQSGNRIAEITRTGVVVRQVDLSAQGVNGGEISGLAFHSDGDLLVSSDQGVVYKVNRNFNFAQPTDVTITGIVALAEDGTPTNAGQASANVAQVIEITGTGFGPSTQVLFQTRDNAGTTGVVAVGPTAINAAGTRMQVVVPDLATTGTVTVRTIGLRNLGFGGNADAIYRAVTVDFTATGTTASVQFSDEGLQGIGDESWGLDNVQVAPVAAPGSPVFTDTFEGGANAAWSDLTTDASLPGSFTQFSGRHNGIQTLSLTGLTNGTAYRMTFDLYILDSWDGNQPSSGPDLLNVFVDGQPTFHEAFSNVLGSPQTYAPNVVGDALLQIVPVVTGLASGKPGEANQFTLVGSGFMEGASTITIGGVARLDQFTNQSDTDVTGTRNSSYQFVAPLTVEGPIRVTTAGGFHQIAGPTFTAPAFVELTGLTALAPQGAVANGAQASANTGQAIVLTGRGFTTSTLVQFDAQDDTGTAGTLTRTGTPNAAGTQLTVIVPALAKTGTVRVVGDTDTALALQIVPTLRSLGGTIVAGTQLILEGTGLIEGNLTITIDGRVVGTQDVRTILDNDTFGFPNGFLDQQLVQLTVPNLVTAGVVQVTTAGGSFTLRPATTVSQSGLVLATEVGDTLATAQALTVATNSQLAVTGAGLNINVNLDVDLFSVTANAGDVLTVDVTRLTGTQRLRVFNAAGVELAADSFSGPNSSPQIRNLMVPVAGTYYLGVSGSNNTAYDPTVAGSGVSGNVGTYTLTIKREDALVSAITGITVTLGSGTAAQSGVPSANTGQTITLIGTGFVTGDQVVFETVDNSGRLSSSTVVTPTTIAADGLSLTVVVPANAATGMVRLAREQAGHFIQIVPTLTSVENFGTATYHGGFLRFTGTGIYDQGVAVQFGGTTLPDSGPFTGPDAFSNVIVDVSAVPNGVPVGPFRIQTLGGTSAAFGPTFTGITATATSGTPANGGVASANPGQAITLTGTGFSLTTDVIFQVSNPNNGVISEQLVNPTAITGTTDITVLVPLDAITGPVQIVGDQLNSARLLQIVPVVTGVDLTSVNTAQANFTLSGFGLIEGTGTRYQLGTVSIVDPGIGTGPDAFSSNTRANLNSLAFEDALFGAVVVTTAGGTSAPFSVPYTQLLSSPTVIGTPADPGQPSANPGQTVTIVGTGFTLQTDIVARYIADNTGLLVVEGLTPTSVNGAGTQAVVTLPSYYNGGFALNVVGSSFSPLLQIVPVVTAIDVTGVGTAQISGQGFTEGNGTVYQWAGGSLTDTAQGTGPDVFSSATRANVTLPVQGAGAFTMTTSGGTSVPLAWNVVSPGLGALIDVAYDPATSSLWVADNNNISRINKTTGAVLNSFDIPVTVSTNNLGLQFVATGFTLNATAVPTGSLLITNGSAVNDQFIAVNAMTGATIASLTLGTNFDFVAGVYHAGRNTLFGLDGSPDQLIEINPATGATVNTFALGFDVQSGGLAIDAANNLWISTNANSSIRRFNVTTNTVDQTIDLAKDGISTELTGLANEAPGFVVGSSNRGVVYFQLDPPVDGAVPAPAVEIEPSLSTAGLALSSASAESNDTSLAMAFTQQPSWLSSFVNGGTLHEDDEELVIALPAGV